MQSASSWCSQHHRDAASIIVMQPASSVPGTQDRPCGSDRVWVGPELLCHGTPFSQHSAVMAPNILIGYEHSLWTAFLTGWSEMHHSYQLRKLPFITPYLSALNTIWSTQIWRASRWCTLCIMEYQPSLDIAVQGVRQLDRDARHVLWSTNPHLTQLGRELDNSTEMHVMYYGVPSLTWHSCGGS